MDNYGHKHRGDEHKKSAIADEQAAHTAWDLWKSHDPADWDKALAERERINKHNPRAWKKAMQEEDLQERHKTPHVSTEPNCTPLKTTDKKREETTGKLQVKAEASAANIDSDEADKSRRDPNSTTFDAVIERRQPQFYGLDLGIAKLGVNSNGSLETGINIGIAKAGVQVGLENRVDGEFMPIGGPLRASAGAGVGIDQNGLHSDVGAGGNFFDIVRGEAGFDTRVGRDTGIDGDVSGKVYPFSVEASAGSNLGPQGIYAYTGANLDIADQVGVRTGADIGLNSYDSNFDAGVGFKLAQDTLDFGPSIYSQGNTTIKPHLHLDQGSVNQRPFYPDGERNSD